MRENFSERYSVYRITNILNGKIYIGKTKQNPPVRRWAEHTSDSRKENPKMYIHRAMKKYGIENFLFEVIAQYKTHDDLCQGEVAIISQYNSNSREYGYNLTNGGEGPEWTDERKSQFSEKMKGEGNLFFGKKHTEETKQLLSEIRKEEYSNPENHPWYGRKHTEETKLKISESKIGVFVGDKNAFYGKKTQRRY